MRTEVRITAVGAWGSNYEVRLVQAGPGGPVSRSAVYENSEHLSREDKPSPASGDLWLLCAAARLEAAGLPEVAVAPDAEVVVVTATRGGDAATFALVGRLKALHQDRSIAPHLFDLLQFASTGQPKAFRMIEPPIGPGSEVQFRSDSADGPAGDAARPPGP